MEALKESTKYQENSKEKYSFVLAFSATCWKRIWYCIILYCNHQKTQVTNSIILKCLKYNLLCPTGIFFEIEPYLKKALTEGFLMPKEYGSNFYIKRSVRLFGETYKISKIKDKEEKKKSEMKFIHSFAATVFTDKKKEKEKELFDIIKKIPNFEKNEKHCTFCELIENWDIEIGLCEFENIYQELIIYSLLQILS
jgi:hypothetical protein